MKALLVGMFGVLALPFAGLSQSATDLNEGSQFIALGNNNYQFTWWARAGTYYLVDISDDLVTWTYIEELHLGLGGVSAPVFFNSVSGDRFFVRLNRDPFHTDVDGDGISDGTALLAGLTTYDPDPDGDGWDNATERARGTNPRLADSDGDGVSDSDDPLPLDPSVWSTAQLTSVPGAPVITLLNPPGATQLP
jgi:hypothetical protein